MYFILNWLTAFTALAVLYTFLMSNMMGLLCCQCIVQSLMPSSLFHRGRPREEVAMRGREGTREISPASGGRRRASRSPQRRRSRSPRRRISRSPLRRRWALGIIPTFHFILWTLFGLSAFVLQMSLPILCAIFLESL